MSVAEHCATIELQDMDDTIYDDIDVRPAAQERDPLQEEHHVDTTTTAEMDEDGHYDWLDVQQMDDAIYDDIEARPTAQEREPLQDATTTATGVDTFFPIIQ